MAPVLLADDNAVTRSYFVAAFARLGVDCAVVADGEQALAACAQEEFKLLLLDCRMPGMHAHDTLARLRASGVATPAVATSADATPALEQRMQAAGFLELIAKPVSLQALQRLLTRLAIHASISALESPTHPATISAGTILEEGPALQRIGGDPAILAALRTLFMVELQALPDELASLTEYDALASRLHRLHASAMLCGAPQLAMVCGTLQAPPGAARIGEARVLINQEAARTLAALRQR